MTKVLPVIEGQSPITRRENLRQIREQAYNRCIGQGTAFKQVNGVRLLTLKPRRGDGSASGGTLPSPAGWRRHPAGQVSVIHEYGR